MTTPVLARAAGTATVLACRGLLSLHSKGLPDPTGRPRIYVANHVSHADFIALWSALPAALRRRTRPVAGADYWQASPFRRWLIHDVFRGVLVERGTGAKASPAQAEAMISDLTKPLLAGEDLIFFPEGTRNLTNTDLMPLRAGIHLMLRQVPKAEVIPVWISSMDRILPKGALVPVPLSCELRYGPAVHYDPEESRPDFIARLHAAILACRRPAA